MSTTIDNSGLTLGSGVVISSAKLRKTYTLLSGTSVTFSGIPTWARRITLAFGNPIQLSGSDDVLLQFSSTTTGYVSTCVSFNNASAASGVNNTNGAGFYIFHNSTSYLISGIATLQRATTTSWMYSFTCKNGTSNNGMAAGYVTGITAGSNLIIKPSGTNTFTSGYVIFTYE